MKSGNCAHDNAWASTVGLVARMRRRLGMSFLFMAAGAAMVFAPRAHAQLAGENFIASDEGEIVLFALPGCELNGKKGLYGLAYWKDRPSELVCWQYDNVIYVQARGGRQIIFDPSDVRTRDVGASPDRSYSGLPYLPAFHELHMFGPSV